MALIEARIRLTGLNPSDNLVEKRLGKASAEPGSGQIGDRSALAAALFDDSSTGSKFAPSL
jgi:hypothetical protein